MIDAARDWLIAGAPGATSAEQVFAGTCERLVAAGVRVAHGESYVRTLHPLFAGRAFVWDLGSDGRGTCRAIEAGHEADLVLASGALRLVFETGEPVRQASPASCPHANGNLVVLVDVLALPMRFTDGQIHAVAFGTERAPGFTPAEIAAIEGVLEPLSRMGEILALRRTELNIVNAYVGRDAGARVLAGQIRRGDTSRIEAAIWFSDMRGFSAASDRKSPHETIAMLNELFDCQLPAIERHGGEVLKFIGDGLLAIFAPTRRRPRRVLSARAGREPRRARRGRRAQRARERAGEVRHRVAFRRGRVRQHRRRDAPRLHVHRARGEPRGAARVADRTDRARRARERRVRAAERRGHDRDRRVHGQGLRRAGRGIRAALGTIELESRMDQRVAACMFAFAAGCAASAGADPKLARPAHDVHRNTPQSCGATASPSTMECLASEYCEETTHEELHVGALVDVGGASTCRAVPAACSTKPADCECLALHGVAFSRCDGAELSRTMATVAIHTDAKGVLVPETCQAKRCPKTSSCSASSAGAAPWLRAHGSRGYSVDCTPLPASCGDTPTCACLGPNAQFCREAPWGIELTYPPQP